MLYPLSFFPFSLDGDSAVIRKHGDGGSIELSITRRAARGIEALMRKCRNISAAVIDKLDYVRK